MPRQIIVFYKGRKYPRTRPMGWFLAWWQKSDYSHCETVLRRVADVYECAGAKFLAGVRRAHLRLAPEDWDAWEIPADVQMASDWLAVHEGDHYDPVGIFGFIFRRIKGMVRAWFCSEACAAMAGFQDPWRYDVATLRSACMRIGRPVRLG